MAKVKVKWHIVACSGIVRFILTRAGEMGQLHLNSGSSGFINVTALSITEESWRWGTHRELYQNPLSQIKLLLPEFHRNKTHKYNNTALFGGGCWVSLTGLFHRHSAAGWAECTVAGPGRVRRQAAKFSGRSSTPLIGHDF